MCTLSNFNESRVWVIDSYKPDPGKGFLGRNSKPFRYLASRNTTLLAAADGQPDKLRCELRFEFT